MSKWIVNTYTFSPIQGGYFVTQGNLNYTLISGNLTLNAGDTSKVTFVVPKSVADDLYPVRTLVEVKFGNGLNPERKFFGTVVKKTRMVPEGTYRFDAVGVLGSYQFLPNYNNYGADATVGSIISVESQRFRGYYQSGSPYYTPSPWEMLYSGHDEIPSAFGSLVGPYANLKLTCNLESLQKRSKNAYEFLKAITNEQSFVLPEDYVNPPYIFRWFENGETARFGQIAGENEQAITYDTNLISCSLAEEPYYTRVVTYGNSGGTYYYNEQSGNGYPCPFNYARIPLPNKADGSAYTYLEVQNATRGELKKYPQLIEATAFDRHIVDESVPWLDLSKRVYVVYAPDEYVKAEITQIVYDFADPTKDRVKLGKIVQTATDSIATVSEQIVENAVKEYLALSGGTMQGDIAFKDSSSVVGDSKLTIRDRIFGTCNLIGNQTLTHDSLNAQGQPSGTDSKRLASPMIKVSPSTSYTIKCSSSYGFTPYVFFYDSSENYISVTQLSASIVSTGVTYTTTSTTHYVRHTFIFAVNVDENTLVNLQLEKGSSASSYVPFAMDNVELTKRVTWKYRGELVNTVSFDADDVELMIVPTAYNFTMQRAEYFIADLRTSQSPSNIVSAFQTATSYAWATFYRSGNSIILQDKQVGSSWSAGNVKFYVYTRK